MVLKKKRLYYWLYYWLSLLLTVGISYDDSDNEDSDKVNSDKENQI